MERKGGKDQGKDQLNHKSWQGGRGSTQTGGGSSAFYLKYIPLLPGLSVRCPKDEGWPGRGGWGFSLLSKIYTLATRIERQLPPRMKFNPDGVEKLVKTKMSWDDWFASKTGRQVIQDLSIYLSIYLSLTKVKLGGLVSPSNTDKKVIYDSEVMI